MSPIFRYFWFVAAGAMAVNVMLWRRHLSTLVARGITTRSETDRVVSWLALGFVGMPLVLGLISLAAGWPSPFCAGVLSFADLPRGAVSVVTCATWAAALWWLWRGGGDEFLARVASAATEAPWAGRRVSPAIVRIALTLMVLWAGVGSAVMWRTMPLPVEAACPAARAVG